MNHEYDRSHSSNTPHSKQKIEWGWKDTIAFLVAFFQTLLLPLILFFAMLIGIYLLLSRLA